MTVLQSYKLSGSQRSSRNLGGKAGTTTSEASKARARLPRSYKSQVRFDSSLGYKEERKKKKKSKTMATMTIEVPAADLNMFEVLVRRMGWILRNDQGDGSIDQKRENKNSSARPSVD